ncbi:MAG: DNA recombination protein RmuC [Bacteroidales bacterium]|nr:DNA recombination protein RmuC [Bacteroidales bacterium]
MELLYLIIGLLVGIFLAFIYFKQREKALSAGLQSEREKDAVSAMERASAFESQIAVLNERIKNTTTEKDSLEKKWTSSEEENNRLQNQVATLQTESKHLEEKLAEGKNEMEQLQERFKSEFQNLANAILKQNTKEFNESSQKQMNDILNPLKEKIMDFEKKVEETYQKGKIDQTVLKEELKRLQELNKQLGEEAGNLTKALKSDSKKQGNWGEVVLERILERSGLIKDEEYFLQYTAEGENGKVYRPDVVIKLPEEKHLVIDSKVSLTAFQQYISAEEESKRDAALKQHILSIKNHIKELREKNYDQLKGLNTPDFVLMFLPVEPAFAVAVQTELDLFNDAFEKGIIIVSPTTLLATLRTVASIWRHERQTQNALEIASQGASLYDKFVGFMEDLEKIGTNLNKAQESYNEAQKKLTTGRGNLVRQVEKLKQLGVKTSKSIDQKYLDN